MIFYLLIMSTTFMYVFLVLVSIFHHTNNTPMKIVRVLSLPVVLFVILLFALAGACVMTKDFVLKGIKAFNV
ncbi:hypothetical protein AB832_06925 [Flavobacteriaceae bacterium (ex Bugula neritina AB1)]|nr:hypothetical protein AB832_06925 [Flavobacteriaceae bacterium (ex Bugula neritina AB1)]